MGIATEHKLRELEIRVAAIEALLEAQAIRPKPKLDHVPTRETLKLKRG